MTRWQKPPCRRDQAEMFPTYLDDVIGEDHPVRLVDEILDTLDWSAWEAHYDGYAGQPAIHPSVMCKALLYAMIQGIRSSRRIEYALSHHIDFMWLVERRTIDHTTISKFRTAHQEQIRELYKDLCRQAVALGAAKLSQVCIDGSRILGNANRYRSLTEKKATELIAELDRQLEKALAELRSNDELDEVFGEDCGDKLPPELEKLETRRAKLAEAREQLRHMDEQRRGDGINPEKNPAQAAAADLDARIMPNKTGGYAPNYTPMAVTETSCGLIVGADVLIGNVEHTTAVAMIDAVEADYGERPEKVLMDQAYSTGPNLAAFEQREIDALSPIADLSGADNPAVREDPTQPVPEEQVDELPRNKQTKRFAKEAFVYDPEKDVYHCPAGQEMPYSYTETATAQGETVKRRAYAAPAGTCRECPLRSKCRTNPDAKNGRSIRRDEYEEVRERHRQKMRTPEAQKEYEKRLHFGETPFAFIKQWIGMRQFLLRGVGKVKLEWCWGAAAFNTMKLMRCWREFVPSRGRIRLET